MEALGTLFTAALIYFFLVDPLLQARREHKAKHPKSRRQLQYEANMAAMRDRAVTKQDLEDAAHDAEVAVWMRERS
jgi:type II secretory pathway component PulM